MTSPRRRTLVEQRFEFYQQVAETYLDAESHSRPTTRAVMEAWPGTPWGTAASWITRARSRGLLPPAIKGQKAARRMRRLARELGLPEDQVRRAVVKVYGENNVLHRTLLSGGNA